MTTPKHTPTSQPRQHALRHWSRRVQVGFTLIELLLSVTIAGILSSVAYPAYQGTVQKVRRCDALVALMELQMAQERFRSNNTAYGSLSDLAKSGARANSASGHYRLDVLAPSEAGFVALATAAGSQSSDSACGVLKLSVDGANVTYASGADTSVGNDSAANKRCWSL
jgi:type IV pilus assembly protein PilE